MCCIMKCRTVAFWLIVLVSLFAFLQVRCRYHFFFIEQSQLFQFAGEYVMGRLSVPGGFAQVLSEFLVQFFLYPYAGAGITAALLLLAGIGTRGVVNRIVSSSGLTLLCLIPVASLMFLHFDFNYFVSGTISFDLMLLTLCLCLGISDDRRRMVAEIIAVPLLYALLGAVACLFALAVSVYEFLNKTSRPYLVLLSVLLAGLCGISSVYFALFGEYRFALLPDAYYHTELQPKTVIYYPWISLILVMVVAFLMRRRKTSIGRRARMAGVFLQLCVLLSYCLWGVSTHGDRKAAKVKELDYYVRTEQWEKIVDICRGKLTNYLNMCYLNLALAQRGELADRMFSFDQRGSQGLMVGWNKTDHVSSLLSDIAYAIGNVAMSQEMAFEAYVTAKGEGNPRMLKRLVQTNIIYGEYQVAEKYLNILSNTLCYKGWAEEHRRFLYNDAAVEQDAVLGAKRRCLPKENHLSELNNVEKDLRVIAESNPESRVAVHYLGALYLLEKDMDGFCKMVETYYGTDVLPTLPKSFQEAVITLSENDRDYWRRFDVAPAIVQRFDEYKREVLSNRSNPNMLPGLMKRSFGDTFWFYFMFK